MKLTTSMILIACFFLVACTTTEEPMQPAETTPVEPEVAEPEPATTPETETVPATPEVEAVPPTTPTPTETEAAPEKTRSKALERLLETSADVDNYEYSYTAPPHIQSQDMIYVKGTKSRIDLMQSYNTEILPYTTVFIDWEAETAEGHCLLSSPRCKKDAGVTELDPADFHHPTPLDWLDLVREHATSITTSKLVLDKKAQGTTFLLNGKEHTVFLDVFGMPVRVEVGPGGAEKSYNYNKLVINSVNDEQVTPPV